MSKESMCQEHGYLHPGFKLRHLLLLLIPYSWSSQVLAETRANEVQALYSMAGNWQKIPRSWVGSDPSSSNWVGINCSNSHVIYITLPGLGISGTLSADIQNLPELVYLDLSFNQGLGGEFPSSLGNLVKLKRLIVVGCSFSGSIPPELGKLPNLSFLGLNSNLFSGAIPGELGNLSSLTWFDLTNNHLSGSIPVSTNTSMGLDMLSKCEHFHFGNNNLSGPIPAELFHPGLRLRHVLFDNNKLTGNIPPTIGLVTTLEALRLDNNSLTGSVPSNLNNLTRLSEMKLSNNQLTGPLPNLTGMTALAYVDFSNNSFDESDVPTWFSTLPSLTTLEDLQERDETSRLNGYMLDFLRELEYLKVAGPIPSSLFNISTLQKARLRTNFFNETLDLGSQFSSQLTLVDLQGNRIDNLFYGGFPNDLLLEGNPYCLKQGAISKFCNGPQKSTEATYITPATKNCWSSPSCPSDQQMSPLCTCSYPFEGTIVFRFITFSNIENTTYYRSLETALYKLFQDYNVPVSALSLRNPELNIFNYFQFDLWIFPAGKDHFNEADVVLLANLFSNNTFKPPSTDGYGPYYFNVVPYPYFPESRSKANRVALIVGVATGVLVIAALLIGLVVFALGQKRKAKKDKDSNQVSGSLNVSPRRSGIPQLKGSRIFSFEELKKCTNSFSEANVIGSGSYGKVYRGALVNGELVAVKRAQEESIQGGVEFKTEIEMLSRVHHRNLVSLVGFCFDQNEQILVYEYVPNGSLRESLSGKSGVHLDWKKRLRIALGAARGLTYLHDLAIPRIIHRDIKSNNILLDHNLDAKVSDFGLCKPLGDDKRSHITTQVKGTMGYLDPEYYMTQQLTERSDVYSFGVVMLELVTARKPIERGRFIVRQVRNAMNISKDLHGLHEVLDPAISSNSTLQGFKRYMDLAMRCVEESSADRPWMSEVTKEIESIAVEAGMNPYISSETNSASLRIARRSHPYDGGASFDYSGGPYSSKVEPK